MPQDVVEVRNAVVRTWFATFDGDSGAFRDTLHPDVEWFPFEENHSRYCGVEEAMRLRNGWLETWGDHRFDVEEVIEEGDDVVARVHITARGRTSGAKVDVSFYAQFRVRDERVIRIFDHGDRAAALSAAGLAE
jgi:ketosteroid isomerase-like protein